MLFGDTVHLHFCVSEAEKKHSERKQKNMKKKRVVDRRRRNKKKRCLRTTRHQNRNRYFYFQFLLYFLFGRTTTMRFFSLFLLASNSSSSVFLSLYFFSFISLFVFYPLNAIQNRRIYTKQSFFFHLMLLLYSTLFSASLFLFRIFFRFSLPSSSVCLYYLAFEYSIWLQITMLGLWCEASIMFSHRFDS